MWVTENSTIDNAILAEGFLFCTNYFSHNSEIVEKTTILLNSMDLTAAISATGDKMYMIPDDKGSPSVVANPFNEYMFLAALPENLGFGVFTKYNNFDFDSITSVNEVKQNSSRMDNYPNPFSSYTNILFEITAKSKGVLEIYSLNGQKIK